MTVGVDDLVKSNPDKIIVAPCGLNLTQAADEVCKCLETKPWWGKLRAVSSGSDVALVDGNLMFNRPGPRLVEALEWLSGWFNLENQSDNPSLSTFPWKPYRLLASSPSAPSSVRAVAFR